LAVLLPYLLWYQREQKKEKMVQYGQRVWGLTGEDDVVIHRAIEKLSAFFNSVNMPTRLTHYGIDPDEAAEKIRERFIACGVVLGEHHDIRPDEVAEILRLSR